MPSMTEIVCRFCGAQRLVLTKVAHRYSTCGSPKCVAHRRSEGGRKSKGQGEHNPRYSHGLWINTTKICEQCGTSFVGPTKRHFCSLTCSARHKSLKTKGQPFSEERKAHMKGRSGTGPKSDEWKAKASAWMSGANNPHWLHGLSQATRDRSSHLYREWRDAVLSRDNHHCRHCGNKSQLIAHHRLEWWANPQLRYTVSNGITLCRSCHNRTHQMFLRHEKP